MYAIKEYKKFSLLGQHCTTDPILNSNEDAEKMSSSYSYLSRYPFALSGKLTNVVILQLPEPLPLHSQLS
jgi:hypothetical protein